MREERLRARESNGFSTSPLPSPANSAKHKRHQEIQSAAGIASNNKSFRYMRRQPSIVQVMTKKLKSRSFYKYLIFYSK